MWTWAIWAALIFGFVAVVAATVHVGRSLLALWRRINRTQRALFDQLDALANAAERAADRTESVGAGTERLTVSLDHLARSRRRLAVLQTAWSETADSVATVTAFYPRK
ncbi:MAG TPA: hypothetical protein VH541_00435 [Gaiellaceae bacterium]|jgi:hypothetical protein